MQGNEAAEFAGDVLEPMVAGRVTWERGQGTSDSDFSSGQAPSKASEGQFVWHELSLLHGPQVLVSRHGDIGDS